MVSNVLGGDFFLSEYDGSRYYNFLEEQHSVKEFDLRDKRKL